LNLGSFVAISTLLVLAICRVAPSRRTRRLVLTVLGVFVALEWARWFAMITYYDLGAPEEALTYFIMLPILAASLGPPILGVVTEAEPKSRQASHSVR
jgi:hypothetical protein